MTTPPVYFISYARADTEHKPFRKNMQKFREDLRAAVAAQMGHPMEGIDFFDETSIETGTRWEPNLAEALQTTRVAVTLYSPYYFNSRWCGKEFNVFLKRANFDPVAPSVPIGIVPVLWQKCGTFPGNVAEIQYRHDAFSKEYADSGIQTLLSLRVYADKYRRALSAIAESVVKIAGRGLNSIGSVDLDRIPSAWDDEATQNVNSHKEGSIAKTCFVFVSKLGWDWNPYPNQSKTIGAIAQTISGDLGLRYEEIACDAELPQKLKETRDSSVPTLLIGDPGSLFDSAYAQPMKEYDDLYLLNCGALVPWSGESKNQGDNDATWVYLKQKVCQQKTKVPPPNHEWRSIFSPQDLESKTRTVIENLRLRLLQQILSEDRSGGTGGNNQTAGLGTILRAEDADLTNQAATQGIKIDSAPQIEGPAK